MLVLDSDAFRFLRDLSLLAPVCGAFHTHDLPVVLTEYVARHELAVLGDLVRELESSAQLAVESLPARSPASTRYRQLKQAGADRGEAEAIAWICENADIQRVLFVTRDKGATRLALRNGVAATDVFGVLVEAMDVAGLDATTVQAALVRWDDPSQQLGKPTPWLGLEQAALRHRASPPRWAGRR
jgi:predicted nucleic acid-binding protein